LPVTAFEHSAIADAVKSAIRSTFPMRIHVIAGCLSAALCLRYMSTGLP
jgi:4-hydroxy-3-methylbut-2-en-1-yl diphosphate synthase IspG/GcpE